MKQALAVLWAGPNSLLGLLLGLATLATGGRAQVRRGVVEFYGGMASWLLRHLAPEGILAMTLGHTILGLSSAALDYARDHEHVHVRQYQRWGPFFLPAYGWCSLVAWWAGRRAYRDNYFEREAYGDEC
ncbi:hypothetical protein NG895_27820 [Aeoliella sp. ICT_H6.2]|uniref:Uncharacterized protein n=1 Tax=Aeoliella straminimaris TaxID=2954799 RepID=A0A9X2FEU0_9BACT|nr:hypothetical protein [Aeoliella straminimaris]MCO6047730.1 hypothetical protein [Aeoliella straminimaris]